MPHLTPGQGAEPEARPSLRRLLFEPNLSINGPISDATLSFALGRLEIIRSSGDPLIMELNTTGGDADVARRIALEMRLFGQHMDVPAYCVGKTAVYSAGVTIFAAFNRSRRFLTEDAVILVHERRLTETLELKGPLQACLQLVREKLAMLEQAEALEREGFAEFVAGSGMSLAALRQRALANAYISAEEALSAGLIADILR